MLQAGRAEAHPRTFVCDFFDFSIYVDADEADIEQWYVERFLSCARRCSRTRLSSTVRRAATSRPWRDGAGIWDDDQRPQPAREHRSHARPGPLILEKGADHTVRQVKLRKL